MSDIVERLKDGGVFPMTFGTSDVKDVVILYDPMTPTDAIKEIERLRAALREIAEHADLYGPPDQGDAIALIHVARRALENQ